MKNLRTRRWRAIDETTRSAGTAGVLVYVEDHGVSVVKYMVRQRRVLPKGGENMAVIKPASTSLRLELSLGQEGGKEITKSVAVSGVDVNATPDALYNTANALAALLEHPMVNIRHTAHGHITE